VPEMKILFSIFLFKSSPENFLGQLKKNCFENLGGNGLNLLPFFFSFAQDKNKESGFINQVAPSLISTLILLLPKLPAKDAILLPTIKTLRSVCKKCPEVRSFLSESHLQQLLKIGHQIGVSDIAACDDLLVFGCTYASKQCDKEHEITSIMRELIFLWKGTEKIK
jgi:hypothetical protein